MMLLTPANRAALPALYTAESDTIHVKFFCPWNNWTWYAMEFDPDEGRFYGLVDGQDFEWGYFSLAELESITGPGGLKIESDLHFTPRPASEIKQGVPA